VCLLEWSEMTRVWMGVVMICVVWVQFILTIVISIWMVRQKWCCSGQKPGKGCDQRWFTSAFTGAAFIKTIPLLMVFTYPLFTETVLSYLNCQQTGGSNLLARYPSIDCDPSQYHSFL